MSGEEESEEASSEAIDIHEHDKAAGTYRVLEETHARFVAELDRSVNVVYNDELSQESIRFVSIKWAHLPRIVYTLTYTLKYRVNIRLKQARNSSTDEQQDNVIRCAPGDPLQFLEWSGTLSEQFDDTVTTGVVIPFVNSKQGVSTTIAALNTCRAVVGICTLHEGEDDDICLFPETVSLLTQINAAEVLIPIWKQTGVTLRMAQWLLQELHRQGFNARHHGMEYSAAKGREFLKQFCQWSAPGHLLDPAQSYSNGSLDIPTESDTEDMAICCLETYNKLTTNSLQSLIFLNEGKLLFCSVYCVCLSLACAPLVVFRSLILSADTA
eukprot:gb/GECG01010120.1/.p1 GENE.gb/GECG01010120.1/~~gb/GECG01010120.1/.p1  ORF type:complete len:326 (+),score=42.97 gb/GECG01010120.1/:1-978(+)